MDWKHQVCCIDGVSGYTIAPHHPARRTTKAKRPWESAYIVIKWLGDDDDDDDDTEYYDKAVWKYNDFHPHKVVEAMNFWNWVYEKWSIVAKGVCGSKEEIDKITKQYLN